MTTIFTLARHGQTQWNVDKRKQGHTDIPLNEKGREEALMLGHKIKDLPFTACYSSNLQRAHETAIIALNGRLPVQMDARLKERNYGKWEGKLSKDYSQAKPHEKEDVEHDTSVLKRLKTCLQEYSLKHPNGHILIVAHNGLLASLLCDILKIPYSSISAGNGSYVTFAYEDFRIIDQYNIEYKVHSKL